MNRNKWIEKYWFTQHWQYLVCFLSHQCANIEKVVRTKNSFELICLLGCRLSTVCAIPRRPLSIQSNSNWILCTLCGGNLLIDRCVSCVRPFIIIKMYSRTNFILFDSMVLIVWCHCHVRYECIEQSSDESTNAPIHRQQKVSTQDDEIKHSVLSTSTNSLNKRWK